MRVAFGFPGLHLLNAGLYLVYSLAQTLVFSRVLNGSDYASAIAIVAVGLYLIFINQAVSRANFMQLRQARVTGEPLAGGAETAAFQLSQIIMALVSFLAPVFVSHSPAGYVSLVCLMIFTTFTNLWFFEIQTVMFATDRAVAFEVMSLARRAGAFASLAWLYLHRDFLAFNISLLLQTLVAHVWAIWVARADGNLLGWPRRLTAGEFIDHGRRLLTSAQATGGEWLTLNSPYAIFTLHFGVGPQLIALDAVMKVLRIVLSATRNTCEVTLPRVSRDLVQGHGGRAQLLTLASLGACLTAGVAMATAIVLFEHPIFSILLGPNNAVPHGAGAPAAAAIIIGVIFQVASLNTGFFAGRLGARTFLVGACVSCLGLAGYIFLAHPSPLAAFWAFAASLALPGLVAIVALVPVFAGQMGARRP